MIILSQLQCCFRGHHLKWNCFKAAWVTWQINRIASFLLIADCTCKCGDVCQHQGSRWALPRARLSALCQALLMSASASLQRFWRDESNTSLCGRSICKEWQSTRAQPHSFPGQVRNLRCKDKLDTCKLLNRGIQCSHLVNSLPCVA